jgi:hypothetical protein
VFGLAEAGELRFKVMDFLPALELPALEHTLDGPIDSGPVGLVLDRMA